ncbi:hypothetical protein Ciccas_001477 [Cichlidogyrus casuarinus]|uniref:Uncharacterized protein n=1 Tax=Cichlidogyrus casuarinus TaxID=1844966 RepID=A0ABD2QK84_9PLAT
MQTLETYSNQPAEQNKRSTEIDPGFNFFSTDTATRTIILSCVVLTIAFIVCVSIFCFLRCRSFKSGHAFSRSPNSSQGRFTSRSTKWEY